MSEHQWWQTETNDEVATKRELWQPLSDAIGGFDLDPASGAEPTPIAEERYTPADDGLAQPWHGTVWLNPPFSDKTRWYKKLVNEYWNGDVDRAVALAPGDFSADWFHGWFATADVLCFLDGRDWNLAGDSPSFSTQVGVWNPNERVIEKLQCLGTVVRPINTENGQQEIEQFKEGGLP